jgi:hypothetical protein
MVGITFQTVGIKFQDLGVAFQHIPEWKPKLGISQPLMTATTSTTSSIRRVPKVCRFISGLSANIISIMSLVVSAVIVRSILVIPVLNIDARFATATATATTSTTCTIRRVPKVFIVIS